MKNKLFKFLSLLLVIVFLFTLVGCKEPSGGNEGENEGGNEGGNEENKSIKDQFPCISLQEAIEIATQSGENESAESYYVYGIIVSVSNPTYGEMTITDGTNKLYVYGCMDEQGNIYSTLADKPVAGDEIVLYGKLKTFNDSPEMGRSTIKAFNHIKPEIDENEYKSVTVKEARSAAKDTKVKLTGVVAFITFANGFKPNGFYLVDNTGSIYVYGGDVAQQVTVGNTVTIAAEKTYYILDSEINNAQKFGYEGACQVQNPVLLDNNKQNSPFDKSWIEEVTVKEIMDSGFEENITTNIYKVTAQIKKVPGSGFVNYYINDLDQETGSYVYTACNGNDFDWLDKYDGKICTVYLSPINCKSTASSCFYRFIPIEVKEIQDYKFDLSKSCEFAIEYYALKQFYESYNSDPSLELITSVSNELLGFENVALSYSSSDNNVIYFENNVMHTKNEGEAKVTITATYQSYTYTSELTIKVSKVEVTDFVNVKAAIDSADNTVLKVKGVVVASLVNQTGFYIGDETGIIAVTCSSETLAEINLGDLVVMEGTRIHRKKDPAGAYAGQSVIADSKLVVNYYGNNTYSKESFITDKTLKEVYELDYTKDFTTNVYVVKATILFEETPFYTSVKLQGEGMDKTMSLYCSSGSQYSWLRDFAGKEVTIELAPCNWNGKSYYAGCVLSVTDGEKTAVNGLNFQK